MQTKNVVVMPYNERWKTDFEEIKQELEFVLGDLAIAVEHVGSTSVPGLSAKPIIDIDVVIKDDTFFDAVVQKLSTIGYRHEGDLGIAGREAFDYDHKPHLQKHHLYVCSEGSEELRRHLIFREFLRHNPKAKARYALVKEKAAQLFPYDIDKYMAYKSDCIEELYQICGLK